MIDEEIEEDGVEEATEEKSLRDSIKDAVGDEPEAAPKPEPDPEIAPPEHWSQIDKDAFNDLPPEVRSLYLDKATSLEKGYNEKFEKVASWQKEKAALDEVFAPMASELALYNVDRVDVIRRLAGAHQMLRYDPEGALRQLAAQYGAEYPFAGSDDDEGFLDPAAEQQITQLKQQVAQLQQGFQGFQGQYQSSQEAALQHQIDAFQSAKDADGNLKYPYFDTVRQQMGQLIGAGAAQSLEQAYEMAVWGNGETRQRLMQADQDRAAKEAEAKRKAEADKARKAGAARVAGTSSRGGSGSALTTRDALEQAWQGAA